MSGFDLVPVDGGDRIHLPTGETVLGRGPFLGVRDKRVSRTHGLLDNQNGQLRLKPTNLNPCFVQSSPTDDPRPLKQDTWHPLYHGDVFSLLPGKFMYEVMAVGGEDATLRNSQTIGNEEIPDSPEPDVGLPPAIGQNPELTPPTEEVTQPAGFKQQEEATSSNSFNKGDVSRPQEAEDGQKDATPSVHKRRVLPAWMMAAVAAPQASSSSPKAVKRRKEPSTATSSKGAAPRPAPPTTTSSPEEAEPSEEEEKRRKKRKIHVEETPSKTDVPSQDLTDRLHDEANTGQDSDNSGSFTMEVQEEEREDETSTADRKATSQLSDISASKKENKKSRNGQKTTEEAESDGSIGGSASKPRLRTLCPYGKNCYRKNPVHFQECSHPGDTDYEEEEEDEEEEDEADRPECPYGTDCYRKNPLHRKEFQHTKRPARRTRTVAKKAPDEDEDEDSEDNDSFINDDSEDADDDSDYVPPDSDEGGKEDIKRLQREAKAFLKKRK